jgi:hypothetical protein
LHAGGARVACRGCAGGQGPAVRVQSGPLVEVVTHQSGAVLGSQGAGAEPTVGGVVAVLQVQLHHAGGMGGDHAVLTHIDTVLKTGLVCHLALGGTYTDPAFLLSFILAILYHHTSAYHISLDFPPQ